MNSLTNLRIANPCRASWDQMTGDDSVRSCAQCQLNVYNVAAMTLDEAEAFLRQREGRTCFRLYRRYDGTVLTRDCPVGFQYAARRKVARATALLLAIVLAAFALLWQSEKGTTDLRPKRAVWAGLRACEPFRTVLEWLDPTPVDGLGW